VAFGANDIPLQLVIKDALPASGASSVGLLGSALGQGPLLAASALIRGRADGSSLLLWNVDKQERVSEVKLPETGKVRSLELSKDGSRIAASVILPDNKANVLVWDGATGKLLHEFAHPRLTNALAFSPDNLLLASGDEDGRIRILSLRTGKTLAALSSDRLDILCLAFSPDARLSNDKEAMSGRLVAGDEGATVTIWNLANQQSSVQCRGSHYAVYAVAFSPDGSMLASCGRDTAKLWDTTTGHLLLDLNTKQNGSYVGLAFSPDGKRLAVCSTFNFEAGMVVIWDLQFGRGIEMLRGLSGQVAKIRFSPDGRHLAAFTHGWQAAIWDLPSGRLRHRFDVPKGKFAADAALEFSSDSRRIAFASYQDAKLWEVESGKEIGSWTFPIGHSNLLGFHPSGKLLLFRLETTDGVWPFATDPVEHPRVCRIRELFGPDKTRLIKEIKDFNLSVFGARNPRDGSYFAVDGLEGKPGAWNRKIKAFDGLTGKEIFSIDSTWKRDSEKGVETDPSGRYLTIAVGQTAADDVIRLQVEMPAGKVLGPIEDLTKSVHPRSRYWLGPNDTFPGALTLVRREDDKVLVSLGIDSEDHLAWPQFNASETHLAWGSAGGTVFVCDIAEVQRRLAEIGLGW
jgi:WD40 repeat protein